MRNFRELTVWVRAHQVALRVYGETKCFPSDERFGLTQQVRKSASSVAANIAEGCGRDSDREFVHFLRIASGSASETQYHLILAKDLGYLQPTILRELSSLVEEVRRMLTVFINRVRTNS